MEELEAKKLPIREENFLIFEEIWKINLLFNKKLYYITIENQNEAGALFVNFGSTNES